MGTVTLEQVGGEELALPLRIQEALGALVDSAKEGLLALSVGVGLGVLAELLEEEVVEIVGPKGKHIPERTAVGHGHEVGEVPLGGRWVAADRPRVRSADGRSEVRLRTYECFGDRDLLSRAVLERMLAGVSTVATAGRRSRSARRWSSRRGRRRARRSRVPSLNALAAHSAS
jgi:putative transposase